MTMKRKTPEQILQELDEQEKRIREENRKKEAQIKKKKQLQKQKINEKKKKQEDRKKILIGAMYLDAIKNDPEKESAMLKRMDRFLTRKADREIFGLSTED